MSTATTEPADFTSLYRRAFAEYGTQALWNKRLLDEPTPEDALVIARALRIEGDREARLLAEQIEQACRATL
jgi:predicted lipid carrier protein YhbT